jgi:DNA-directed RNA polymerase subunit RPC12/RpoP
MPSVNQNKARVACPNCSAQYDFPAEFAGKRGQCAKCGKSFTVPGPAQSPAKRAEMPAYIGLECHLCGTRFYGGPDQVGKPLKCPDCGARTVVPPPPPPKKKNIPAAMEGDQYELWEPDVDRLPREMVAHQPKYIAVPCHKCDTLMYATEKQIGETIDCPDCGRSYVVPAPKKPKPKQSPIVSDIDVPMLDPAGAPTERPPALSPETRRMIYEEERDSAYGKALEKSRRTGKPMEVDVRGRPILPRWPLFTGVLPFLFSSGVPVRWLGVSAGLATAISIVLMGLATAASGGMAAIAGMCFFAVGCVLTMVVVAIAFSMFIAIVAESSEGSKAVHNWPPFLDWFGDLFVFLVAAVMSGFPGWALCYLLPLDPLLEIAIFAASIVICFPITVLSQLDIGSMWGVLSPKVVKSLARCPFSWLTFFVLTGLLAFVCIAATYFAAQLQIGLVVIVAPLGTAAFILYGRLLGRLAWRLAEAMSELG